MEYPTNLRQFKAWLKLPGATLVLLDAGLYEHQWPPASLAAAKLGRPIERVQSNAFTLKSGNPDRPNPAWHYFGTAASYEFHGAEIAMGIGSPNIMHYRMEIRP